MTKLKIPKNLTELAYSTIKQYILDGRLTPDQRLTEELLSNRLGISKSPVREALNSLHVEGLIRIEPRRGAYIKKFTVKEVKDLYLLREELESYAVRQAQLTSTLLDELSSGIARSQELLRQNNKLKYIEEDAKFHGLIADATGNNQLCRVLSNIQNQIWLCRCNTYNLSSSVAADSHQAIVAALRQHNRAQAETAMRSHITHVRLRLVEFLEQKLVEDSPELSFASTYPQDL
jgi:DNA-binding GntR family transcriptional regulator